MVKSRSGSFKILVLGCVNLVLDFYPHLKLVIIEDCGSNCKEVILWKIYSFIWTAIIWTLFYAFNVCKWKRHWFDFIYFIDFNNIKLIKYTRAGIFPTIKMTFITQPAIPFKQISLFPSKIQLFEKTIIILLVITTQIGPIGNFYFQSVKTNKILECGVAPAIKSKFIVIFEFKKKSKLWNVCDYKTPCFTFYVCKQKIVLLFSNHFIGEQCDMRCLPTIKRHLPTNPSLLLS